jgi:hypothetical protein
MKFLHPQRIITTIMIISSLLLSSGCGEQLPPGRAVYMLMDTSGTYTQQLQKAQMIINYL